MKLVFVTALLSVSVLLAACSRPVPPLFKNFRNLDVDGKVTFLGTLLDYQKKPFEQKENQDHLFAILQNEKEDIRVRNEALNVLSVQESRDLSEAYLKYYNDPSCPKDLKTNIALELSEKVARNPKILQLFLAKINDTREPDGARMNMALALGDAGLKSSPEILQALAKAYENPGNYPSLRINAITSLAKFYDQELARKTLEKSLKDPKQELRLALASFLTHASNKAFLPWLRILAADADAGVAAQGQKGVAWIEKLSHP